MLTGNREFNESYENYKNLILRTAYTYSGNREAAEDITQETFLKLYIGYDSMKKENIPSWLYTTAKNMALNYKKKAKWEVLAMDDDEDDDFRVILDLGPASKGHALILPKNHYRNLYDIDDEVASKAILLAKKMITKLTDVLNCDGYNIVQNNEEAAGQTVFHFHMHMIPRYKNDNVGLGWHMGELSEADKNEILEKLK